VALDFLVLLQVLVILFAPVSLLDLAHQFAPGVRDSLEIQLVPEHLLFPVDLDFLARLLSLEGHGSPVVQLCLDFLAVRELPVLLQDLACRERLAVLPVLVYLLFPVVHDSLEHQKCPDFLDFLEDRVLLVCL